MNPGWIKLHRKLQSWEWYTDSYCVHLFIHLLLSANHKPRKWRGITIEQGQLVTSRTQLSIETGISEQSIRTTLKKLKSTSELTSKPTNRFTILTIVNWASYQCDEDPTNQLINQPANQQLTSNQPATNQPSHKNDKNVKNEKKERDAREGLTDFVKFINAKTAKMYMTNQAKWLNEWGKLRQAEVDLQTVFSWATNNYRGPIASPNFFVDTTWPKILAAWERRNYNPTDKNFHQKLTRKREDYDKQAPPDENMPM